MKPIVLRTLKVAETEQHFLRQLLFAGRCAAYTQILVELTSCRVVCAAKVGDAIVTPFLIPFSLLFVVLPDQPQFRLDMLYSSDEMN
jgi:hypothetical protein